MRLGTNKKQVLAYSVERIAYRKSRNIFLSAIRYPLSAIFLLFSVLCFFSGCQSAPKVYIKKLKNSHYQLIVNHKPYTVKGVCYNPIPAGEGHSYDWWSDKNKPWISDGKLMREMGVNTIRLYQGHEDPAEVKQVIRDLYNLYGIHTVLGHWLGFWEYPRPRYADKDFQDKVKKEIIEMVQLYKDEPGVLFWILGNENNYSFSGQINPWSNGEIDKEPDPRKQREMRAQIYYSFVNTLAEEMHKIDPNHPVALGNGELAGLETAAKFCPAIDLIACLIYRGKTFGNIFNSLKNTFDRPIVLAEFGADSYDAYLKREDQTMQAFFLEAQWSQIYENLAGSKKGAGNCLGGMIFEWADEWWKHNPDNSAAWSVHDTESNWSSGSYYFDIKAEGNKNMNEEWFGIVNIERAPRRAYYKIKEFWKHPVIIKNKPRK